MQNQPILVTGGTGYVGGRLIPRLLAAGHRVRAVGRSRAKLACRPWARHPNVELAEADALDRDAMVRAAAGCRAAYYLIHSMIAAKRAYADADRRAAHNMVAAAADAGLERMIYLGGLGEMNQPGVSRHLRSRQEVADILRSGPVPVTVLRAAMILGSGSASFEILRYLVERLPLMITPRWVRMPTQPIAVANVLGYLEGCLASDEVRGQTLDIGGPDVVTYQELFDIFAAKAGLAKRRVLPVPVLTPALSARWIHLVTPVPASIAQPLAEGLSIPTVCTEERIRDMIPQRLLGCREAIQIALQRVAQQQVDTCWTDAGRLLPPEWAACGDAEWAGGTIMTCGYRALVQAAPDEAWRPVTRIGGRTGWYYADLLWRLRGLLDRLAGGVGLRRGRRDPVRLQVGDALDFWRVLEVTPPTRLTLLAEMQVPGEALLDIELTPRGPDATEMVMISRFLPRGLAGLVYWFALYPFHELIFAGMLRGMARAIGRPLVRGPERFTPRLPDTCRLG